MARLTPGDGPGADPDALAAIAASVRGSFQTVEDMAQSFIREAIQQGIFPPGHRLNLDGIAATLGVSRMPVRASLRQLESEGLLQIHAYRGATVSVLRPEEIAEIYELRTVLERYLMERAIERLDDELLDRLEATVDALEASNDLGSRLDERREFYRLLYERAGRPRALGQVNHLRGAIGRYLLLQRVDEPHGHRDLLGYLRARDTKSAKKWIGKHLKHISRTLESMVADEDPVTDGTAGVPARADAATT
jgi:DNA-binding GntR family transcriptional regulator